MEPKKEFPEDALLHLKAISRRRDPHSQNLAIIAASKEERGEMADEYLSFLMKAGRITGAVLLDWDFETMSDKQIRELCLDNGGGVVIQEVGGITQDASRMIDSIIGMMGQKDSPVFIFTGDEDKIHALLNTNQAFKSRMTVFACPEKVIPPVSVALRSDIKATQPLKLQKNTHGP